MKRRFSHILQKWMENALFWWFNHDLVRDGWKMTMRWFGFLKETTQQNNTTPTRDIKEGIEQVVSI